MLSQPLVIVITGGPCGGKSTAIPLLRESIALNLQDVDVYTAPEVPTILQAGGCKYPGTDAGKEEELLEFEASILENSFSVL